MVPKDSEDIVQKTGESKSKSEMKKNIKRKKLRNSENFGLYFHRVLKKFHPQLCLSLNTKHILNSFANDMFNRIASEASVLASYTNHKAISSLEIQSAVRLVLPPDLAKHAVSLGIKALETYNNSKVLNSRVKAMNSGQSLRQNATTRRPLDTIKRQSLRPPNTSSIPGNQSDICKVTNIRAVNVQPPQPAGGWSSREETDTVQKWYIHFSQKSQRIYYHNPITQESYWEKPTGRVQIITAITKPSYTESGISSCSSQKANGVENGMLEQANNDEEDLDEELIKVFNEPRVLKDDNKIDEATRNSKCSPKPTAKLSADHLPSTRKKTGIIINPITTDNAGVKRLSKNLVTIRKCTETSNVMFGQDSKYEQRTIRRVKSHSLPSGLLKSPFQDRLLSMKDVQPKIQSPTTQVNYMRRSLDSLKANSSVSIPERLRDSDQPLTNMGTRCLAPKSDGMTVTRPAPNFATRRSAPYPTIPNEDNVYRTKLTKRDALQTRILPRRLYADAGQASIYQTPMQDRLVQKQRTLQEHIQNKRIHENLVGVYLNPALQNSDNEPPRSRVSPDERHNDQTVNLTTPKNIPTTVQETSAVRNKTSSEHLKIPSPQKHEPVIRLHRCPSPEKKTLIGQKRKFPLDEVDDSKRKRISIATSSKSLSYQTSFPFDARQVLEKRKSEALSKCQTSPKDDSRMEWQEIETDSPESKEQISIHNRLSYGNFARSTSSTRSQLEHMPRVIVLDTNVLVKYLDIVEDLLSGYLLEIPVNIVIPRQVFMELDAIKLREECGHGARSAIRIIKNLKNASGTNLIIQDRDKHSEPAKKLELIRNDDFILNCCLQEKEAHEGSKEIILVTADNHLQVSADLEGILALHPSNLKGWAKTIIIDGKRKRELSSKPETPVENFITKKNTQHNDMEMEVDSMSATYSSAPAKVSSQKCESNPVLSKDDIIDNRLQFFVDLLNDEFRIFLNNVLNECNDKEYGEYKRFASQPRHSWTLVHYLAEVSRRWQTLTGKRGTSVVTATIKQLILLAKKFNSNKGDGEFSENDMKSYFSCCYDLARYLSQKYHKLATHMIQRLIELEDEWKQKMGCYTTESDEDDFLPAVDDSKSAEDHSQPPKADSQQAENALKNIISAMTREYLRYKELKDQSCDPHNPLLRDRVRVFYKKVADMALTIKSVLADVPQTGAKVKDVHIFEFLKIILSHQSEHEVTKENVVTLLTEVNLRLRVHGMLNQMRALQGDVDSLLMELDSDDSEFD